jgi:hypothetical protein
MEFDFGDSWAFPTPVEDVSGSLFKKLLQLFVTEIVF